MALREFVLVVEPGASLLLRLPSAHVLSSLLTGSELQIVQRGAQNTTCSEFAQVQAGSV